MLDAGYQYILVGGGLQNGLLALALLARRPGVRLALVEKAPALGGNHTWCFHADDVPEGAHAFVAPLVAHRWPGYEVRFPGLTRALDTAYAAVTSATFDRVVRGRLAEAPGCDLFLDSEAIEVGGREVMLGNGRVLAAELVVDARGPERAGVDGARTGYQKFLGLEVRLRGPHGLDRPTLMDATVPQTDGFRFFYTLPLDRDRLLIEDTYFSDTPTMNRHAVRAEIRAYAAARGHAIDAVVREEGGVLPLPWQAPEGLQAEPPLRAGYQGGWFHPVTGYSFPLAVRLAQYVAGTPIGDVFGPGLARLARDHRKQVRYGCRLNQMLFQWFPPDQRYHVLERFYRLPEATIRRFYALTLTAGDRARILMGKPPRGMSLRAAISAEVGIVKAVEPAVERASSAGEALESSLVAALASALGEGDAGLPAHLWERALLGPAREFLRRPGKRLRGRLVEMCWLLAGGAAEAMPAELPLVVELLHAGSLIVDDIEDGSHMRRGAPALHHVYGTAMALNTGNWMYFWPLALIDRLGLGGERTAELHRRTRQTLLCCHQGQALDLALQVTGLAQGEVPRVVQATTQLKTGALMELGAALGAVAAGASERALEAMCHFGRELGAGLQMLDDLSGITCAARWDKGAEDLRLGRPTWPWAWAAGRSSPATFAELQARARRLDASDDGAVEALRRILAELVGETGRARAQSRLCLALAVLSDALGASPVLDAVADELVRLEQRYV